MTTSQRVALVTGANSGLGRFAARALVDAGYQVVGTSRNASGLADERGLSFVELDVTRDESVAAAVDAVIARFGRINVLVNNAGMGLNGASEENSITQSQRLFDINVFGVMRMTNAVLPHMRTQRSGRIVNISSIFGLMPAPFMAAYSATKFAVEGYSESVDHEVRDDGIRVVLVEPGGTRTGFDDNTAEPDNPLPVYEHRRRRSNQAVAEQVNNGDDPAVVAKAVVAAATDENPKLRYPAGSARQLVALRRFAPRRAFDKQLRKSLAAGK
ncbi:short-chain dehydrogenase/reductase [Mycolicibacterium arabiense]|uniref:Short-chain dehydrogenase/reductase n=1 Tax=Mycolicibacterium arabiense TaxID=1286181 RepID=A0A7I7RTS7_9MYCO|nr:oxidoreductase [Mycolicibacterium arabiense]MCV7375720.1 SDR family NAD(P)-dependent oxidoreductase [Mycolicibacterium arabiense]BBY47620.1 short-chain dehydrogenase/reductase [Mycolicibacterium arabiense]